MIPKYRPQICPTCGQRIQQTKFTRLYGSTLKQLAKRFKRDPSTIWLWHKKGKLAKILEKSENKP